MLPGKTAEMLPYAYRKQRLDRLYPNLADVPEEFVLEWYKDRYDYPRLHSPDEIRQMMALSPEAVLQWLEEAVQLVWAVKRNEWEERRREKAA